ncbi:SGNH/GDSL hydrolase family protein [Neoroseomonas oryzicola]|uniref:SGNH/GDSL hydrolase family protein n=1 Tax=Neoroseomonas oryzicola TaxID=535904 RepID=A0A9X9WNF9_9PROT|nr:SGNH/GDSL hydrolase family protein [Neoroseomonas oryzicola]MBR0661869.1 hypothetical protein [Neoroseomonas oryzicola]NKE16074.1 hypothetical protein [Neoroseomonas oryzicola]
MLRALALLTGLILALPALASTAAPGCGAPTELLQSPPLRATATGIATGRLAILAVGSASVTGAGVSNPAAAWPVRLEALLRERRPDLDLRFEVLGRRGATAAEQWAMIEAALRGGRYDLVIWQVGATEAVRGLPMDDLVAAVGQGLERLSARGIDAVLMGLQFSRFLRANADVDPYRDALRITAATAGAGYFPRYDIMRAWAEAGTVDVERSPRDRRAAEADRLNDCLARALALFIRDGVEEARR